MEAKLDELTDKHPGSDSSKVLFFPDENLLNHVNQVNDVHTLDSLPDAEQEALNAAKLVIDNALTECSDNPAILGSVEFAGAVKAISSNKPLWLEYRTKIKAAKPPGVPMADIDAMAGPQSSDGDKQDSAAAELIELVRDKGRLFFDGIADKAFVSVDIAGVKHTLAINSKAFVEWLSFTYYTHTKEGNATGKSASERQNKPG